MFNFSQKIFSVSEITTLVKRTLEEGFYGITVNGEISNCRPSSTGHLYFSLKDKSAMLNAVMFKGRLSAVGFKPKDGMLVTVKGNISVYAQRGSYQIICEKIEKTGKGEILAMLEERKRKLASEGLFDSKRKKRLPFFPSKIAIITSPTGAAIKDILRVTKRRNSCLDIVILPTPVQGALAAEKIAEQIKRADEYQLGDVIITGRGGGSLEDLLPFSEEVVVRAIANCSIPVISAVGHEIDTSLSDFSADISAPTPSAAAEIVSAGREELANKVSGFYESICNEIQRQIEKIRLISDRYRGENLEESFFIMLQPVLSRFDDLKEELLNNYSNQIKDKKFRVNSAINELNAISPKAILERGYSLVIDRKTEKIVRSSKELKSNQEIIINLHDGSKNACIKGEYNEKL